MEKKGIDYQLYTSDQNWTLLHAGVQRMGTVSLRTIRKHERKWQIWRDEYIRSHPGNYPLEQERNKQPKHVTVFPVDSPSLARVFTL